MKKTLLLLLGGWLWAGLASAQTEAAVDSLSRNRFVTRSTLYGVGVVNLYDTYLSPVEYTGTQARVMHERMRMTKLLQGRVSVQSLLQGQVSYCRNEAETGNELAGMVTWDYGLHYHLYKDDHWKVLVGGLGELNGGFIYNTRNSNNPAQAKAYLNLVASGQLFYHFRVGRQSLTARYQLNVPVAGLMFSPEYQESYYEIFTQGNHHGILNFTTPANEPSVWQMLTLDFPVRDHTFRVGYVADIHQSRVNSIRCHTYSHVLMIGVVRHFYLIRRKDALNRQVTF
jgi:hypothetical protein